MKKVILAALLAVSVSAQAAEFYTESELTDVEIARVTEGRGFDILDAYRQGLEKAIEIVIRPKYVLKLRKWN
ncbi:hypothetical protein SP40_52 [Salmonella phage 40]|nr:hypothetical protein SP40_52 [Salmonella phage 40]